MIKASRDFVCIRLATYEDKEEAEYLKSFDAGRSDNLENTVFCFLSPNGKKKLTRASRGPHQMFRDANDMAEFMNRTAERHAVTKGDSLALPKMKDVRLALNVAECDGLPLVVALASPETLKEVSSQLAKAAFSEALRGRFVFATATDAGELEAVGLRDLEEGIYTIDPDTFGLKGTELARLPLDTELDQLVEGLSQVAAKQDRESKSRRDHIRAGDRFDIEWKSEIPVTDPGSVKAMERHENGSSKRRRR